MSSPSYECRVRESQHLYEQLCEAQKVNLDRLLRYREAIAGLLRRHKVSETDRVTDENFALQVVRELDEGIEKLKGDAGANNS